MASDKDRGYITWGKDKRTATMRAQVVALVKSYGERGLPAPTCRDVFYDLIALYGYPKNESVRSTAYRLLRKARRAGLIRFEEITDDSETFSHVGGYHDPADFWTRMQSYANGYMRDFEDNQPVHLELFCEGAGKVKQLSRVAQRYHIAVRSPGGYDSIAPKRQLALRAAREWERHERPTHVLHMGDLDADGLELFDVLREDVWAFLGAHISGNPEDVLTFKRIAVLLEQVPTKRRVTFDKAKVHENNHRGKRYPYKYEAQLESLGVERIVAIAREEIENVLDLDQIEADKAQSRPERENIKDEMRRLAELVED